MPSMNHTGSGPTLRKLFHPDGVIYASDGQYYDLCLTRATVEEFMLTHERMVEETGFIRPSQTVRHYTQDESIFIGSTARHQDKEGQLTRGVTQTQRIYRHATIEELLTLPAAAPFTHGALAEAYGRLGAWEWPHQPRSRERLCRYNLLGRRLPTPTLAQILREMNRALNQQSYPPSRLRG